MSDGAGSARTQGGRIESSGGQAEAESSEAYCDHDVREVQSVRGGIGESNLAQPGGPDDSEAWKETEHSPGAVKAGLRRALLRAAIRRPP